MPRNRGAFYKGVSERLVNVRHRLDYSRQEMARVLGINAHGYYKNESGDTFTGVPTLD
jgi:DNA-binding XRE family transcriptional regulator